MKHNNVTSSKTSWITFELKILLNLLRQPKKDLMNTCISTNFHSCSTTCPIVTVCFILQHFIWNQYPIPLQALELHRLSWLSPFSKAFAKTYYFLNFHCYIVDPSKMTVCSIFTLLANFNIFWTTNVMNSDVYNLSCI